MRKKNCWNLIKLKKIFKNENTFFKLIFGIFQDIFEKILLDFTECAFLNLIEPLKVYFLTF